MIYTTHIITGAALGEMMPTPLWALIGGIILHHIFDMLPHLDPGYFFPNLTNWKKNNLIIFVGIDLIIGTSAVIGLWYFNNLPDTVLWGALGSTLPDIVDNHPWAKLMRKLPLFKQYHWLHHTLHWKLTKNQIMLGIVTQIILIAMSIIILV